MGTDIHVQVERYEGGKWLRVPHPDLPCDSHYCDGGVYSDETPNEKMRGETCTLCDGAGHYVRSFYGDRNYNVFAILADVRNGTGFAGVDTGDGFVPIDTPRGLPSDLSDEIRAFLALDEPEDVDGSPAYRDEVERLLGPGWTSRKSSDGKWTWWDHPQTFWLGDHSFSRVSVEELLAYDWDRTTKLRGWVDPWNFDLWRRNGQPSSWCGGISGRSVEHVSNAQVARMIDGGEIVFEGDDAEWSDPSGIRERTYTTSLQRSMREMGDFPSGSVGAQMVEQGVRYYTLVEWEKSYRDCAARFLEILHRDIVPLGDPAAVRLVFGFDS